jgi:hypothetical protein
MRYIVAIMVLLSSPAFACGIPPSEVSLGGVEVGETEKSVVEILGAPSERVETGEGTELRYPGLTLTVGWLEQAAPGVERRVFASRAEGRSVCTPKGLCPGMAVAEAARLYGPTESKVRETGTFLEYQPVGEHCWLQVNAPEGTILSLAVACQP